jgi:hypothetical protein
MYILRVSASSPGPIHLKINNCNRVSVFLAKLKIYIWNMMSILLSFSNKILAFEYLCQNDFGFSNNFPLKVVHVVFDSVFFF